MQVKPLKKALLTQSVHPDAHSGSFLNVAKTPFLSLKIKFG